MANDEWIRAIQTPSGNHPEISLGVAWADDPDDTTPTYTYHSERLIGVSCRQYRQSELDEFETGTLTAVLHNRDRALEPFFTASAFSPNVKPRKRLLYRWRWAGVTYTRFGGFIRGLQVSWEQNKGAYVTIVAADYGLVLHTYVATLAGYPEETVDERIARVCTDAGIPTADQDLDTSDVLVAAVPAAVGDEAPTTANALEHARFCARADGGYVYIDRTGKVAFRNRRHRLDNSGSSLGTFGDAAGEIPYAPDLVMATDDSRLWNAAAILTADGIREEYMDAASAQANWESAKPDEQLPTAVPADAAALASLIVHDYATPTPRFPAVKVALSQRAGVRALTSAQIAVLAAAEVGQRFTLTRRPPGGGTAISRAQYIEGIQDDVRVGDVVGLALDISPVPPAITEWTIGTSTTANTFLGV